MNLDDLISELQQNASPEEIFLEKLASNKSDSGQMQNMNDIPDANQGTTVQPSAQPVSRKGKPIQKKAGWTDDDIQKVAELDQQGRIMARAFIDELNKFGQSNIPAPYDPKDSIPPVQHPYEDQIGRNPYYAGATKNKLDANAGKNKLDANAGKEKKTNLSNSSMNKNSEYYSDDPQVNILTKLYNSIF